jgi:transmembrane sensor
MEQFEFPIQDELLVKYLTGSANEEEREDALNWIHQSEANQLHFDQLRDIYEASKTAQPSASYKTDLSWEKVKSMYYKRRFNGLKETKNNNRLYYIRQILKYAALILLLIMIGIPGIRFLGKTAINNEQQVWTAIEAPLGSKSFVTLSDGSKVWLNAGSKLKYPNSFGKKRREVFLEGEAYFDVVKSKTTQFVVRTGYINIKVLGTEFNVKAYPEENTIQTTLVRGLITINGDPSKPAGPKEDIYKQPNQSLTFIKNPEIHEPEKDTRRKPDVKSEQRKEDLVLLPEVDPAIYTSWKDNRWKIQGESLFDLTVKLERRYNVKFQFNSESLREYKFTGILRDETLEQILNLMKLSAPIEYSIRDNTVILNENHSFKNSYDEMLLNRVK